MFSLGAKGDWDSGTLIGSKTLMELIFNPCGEFQLSPEGPFSQIHFPHLQSGAPGIFSDLLRFVQMRKGDWSAKSNGKIPHLFIHSLQLWFLGLRRKACLWQNWGLGDWVCSERLVFGQNTRWYIFLLHLKVHSRYSPWYLEMVVDVLACGDIIQNL